MRISLSKIAVAAGVAMTARVVPTRKDSSTLLQRTDSARSTEDERHQAHQLRLRQVWPRGGAQALARQVGQGRLPYQ
jgi:hypothetical protein